MFCFPSSRRGLAYLFSLVLSTLMLVLFVGAALAQTTVGTGSIVGTIVDPSGAVVGGARVTITDVATGHVISLVTNSSGAYNSGALIPSNYKVRATAKGFRQLRLVDRTRRQHRHRQFEAGNRVGSQVVEVQGSTVQVNTEQATVQGVLTRTRLKTCR